MFGEFPVFPSSLVLVLRLVGSNSQRGGTREDDPTRLAPVDPFGALALP